MQGTKTNSARTTERAEQRSLINWFKWQYPAELMFAIPNGLIRSRLQAFVMAQDGLVSGMPDLMVACPNKRYHGLFIEMKAANGRLSDVQRRMLDFLNSRGYLAVCCAGFDCARQVIIDYMMNKE